MAILYPTSLANLVAEVGTRHCHQTLLEYLSLFFLLYTKRIEQFRCHNFFFKMFLTYVNTVEYVYFASSCYIYIFIHANMIHQQPLSFHYYWLYFFFLHLVCIPLINSNHVRQHDRMCIFCFFLQQLYFHTPTWLINNHCRFHNFSL